MRRVGAVIGIIVLVIGAAVLIFAATFDVNKYRGTIQSELQNKLGRQVTLGEMKLNLFPLSFGVHDLAIADDPHFSTDSPFVKTQELDVSVKLLPLLHKQVEIDSLTLKRPSVNLIKNHAGVWNFASLGHPASEQTQTSAPNPAPSQTKQRPSPQAPPSQPIPNPSPSPQPQSSPEQQISLGRLTIDDGQLSVLDQQQYKTPTIYDHIDINLDNFAPDQPFTLDAAARMAGKGTQEIRLQGKGGPVQQQNPAMTPFHGTLSLKQVGIADFAKFLNSPALNGTDGVLGGETKIDSDSGKLTAQGETNIQNAKVHGMELGYPISAKYDLTDDLSADLLTLRNMILTLGSQPIQMSGTVNSQPMPSQLDVRVKANNVSLAEAAKLAAASGVALSQETNVAGVANIDITAKGAADNPALNGTINGSNIQMTGKQIAQPIQIQSVNLNLTPSQIQSNPFNVVSGGTTVNAQLTVRNYLSPNPLVNATVRAPNAQLPAILSTAKAFGVTALDKVSGQGLMNLDMQASGAVKSLTATEIEKALNGTINVNFNNVKYSGADIGHELSTIAGFLNAAPNAQSAQGMTNILKMTGNIDVKNGIAQTKNLQAQLDIGNVGFAGTANLVDESLNMRVTAVLSQGVSQKVGGQNVGGYMKTALANNQGQLVIPAIVTGTFSHPRFGPDVQQLAQMKLKGLVPNLNNPSAVAGALQNLLGGAKAPAQNQAQPQQQEQQNPLQQLLGAFGKKKQQNPPPQQ
jgi:AsmA protein